MFLCWRAGGLLAAQRRHQTRLAVGGGGEPRSPPAVSTIHSLIDLRTDLFTTYLLDTCIQ